jgi:hypothetical protein
VACSEFFNLVKSASSVVAAPLGVGPGAVVEASGGAATVLWRIDGLGAADGEAGAEGCLAEPQLVRTAQTPVIRVITMASARRCDIVFDHPP